MATTLIPHPWRSIMGNGGGGGGKDDRADTESLVSDDGHHDHIESSLVSDDGGRHHDHLINSLVSDDGADHHLSLHHHHQHQLIRYFCRILLLFGVIAPTYFVLYHSTFPLQLVPRSYSSDRDSSTVASSSSSHNSVVKLDTILEAAAMADKTVIITTLNGAWTTPNSLFDLFLESFRIGNQTKRLLNHLVVIAVDQRAYDRCLVLHPHCYNLSTAGVDFSGEAFFMSPIYFEMMWRRLGFLYSLLKMGYNFVFTDADIMWFRDPFHHFYSDADFQIACDSFDGNPLDLNNYPNGGFMYAKSNNRTIRFYEFWLASRTTYPGLNEQDVLNKIKYHPLLTQIGLKMRFLDTIYFSGFCQLSKDMGQVCTMHANCCVGMNNKIHDLKVLLEDWKRFLSWQNKERPSQNTSWTVPQKCR
ncbi:hypothetical protein U1Q18_001332 [Sarracenia purpurea var. burkii]